jgi:hypothetical protein
MRAQHFLLAYCLLVLWAGQAALADEPKPTPENTVSVTLANPVKPQTFPRPIKFYVDKVVDRSGKPQPMMVLKKRGGVFLDKEPTEIVRNALQNTLEQAGLLAKDAVSADYVMNVYLFEFGLAEGSGAEFFGKLNLNVVLKNVATGKSQTITSLGTSIQGAAVRKKSILKNVHDNLEQALEDGLRNFLRGTKLRDLVLADTPPVAPDKAAPGADTTPRQAPEAKPSDTTPPPERESARLF